MYGNVKRFCAPLLCILNYLQSHIISKRVSMGVKMTPLLSVKMEIYEHNNNKSICLPSSLQKRDGGRSGCVHA